MTGKKKPTSEQVAVAEFAQGLLAYVEDGNVIELRECGFAKELQDAIAAGGLGEGNMPDDLPRPRIMATFRPQKWVNDCAFDVDGAEEFDATDALLERDAENIRGFNFNNYDSDYLARDCNVGEDHDGPFEVDIDETEWDEFFQTNGVEDYTKMTDEQWARIKEKYARAKGGTS